MGMGQTRGFGKGCSWAEGALYCLLVAVLLFAGYAVFRAAPTHSSVEVTFQNWYEDKKGHDVALTQQKRFHRPVLVYIYAPWCPHCKEFSAHVLSNPMVRRELGQYPHVRIAPDHGPAEQQLMAHYGAKGYPSFYVLQPNGSTHLVDTFITTPTLRPKTPDEFIQSLRTVIAQ